MDAFWSSIEDDAQAQSRVDPDDKLEEEVAAFSDSEMTSRIKAFLKEIEIGDDDYQELLTLIEENGKPASVRTYILTPDRFIASNGSLPDDVPFVVIGATSNKEVTLTWNPNEGTVNFVFMEASLKVAESLKALAETIDLEDFPQDWSEAASPMSKSERDQRRLENETLLLEYLKSRGVSDSHTTALIDGIPKKRSMISDGSFEEAENIVYHAKNDPYQLELPQEQIWLGSCVNGDHVILNTDGEIWYSCHDGEGDIKIANTPTEYLKLREEGKCPVDYYAATKS